MSDRLMDYGSVTIGERTYRFVYDEYYQTRGSYAYDTEELTRAAEDEELRGLGSGELVALGIQVFESCDGATHCAGCRPVMIDSIWGCVVSSDATLLEVVKRVLGVGE